MVSEFVEKKKKLGIWRLLSYVFAIFLIVVGALPVLRAVGIIEFILPGLPQLIVSFVLLVAGILILYHMWT
ncbi:hypothetical protein KY335_03025 [Candidatus Woesearchaeota archaeon]|nr:hypothetical protein [Candidatus Woesearchaeota archaeon]